MDTTPPVITDCPSDQSATYESSGHEGVVNVTWTEPYATDASGTATLISRSHQPGFFQEGSTTVSYTFADATGNEAVCTFTVAVGLPEQWPRKCSNIYSSRV